MRIDEAIEILEYHRVAVGDVAGSDFSNAVKLGIEALKGIKAVRHLHPELSPFPLSGETEK